MEIKFPDHFGHTVIYSDNMYDSIKKDYIFPSNLLQKYQQNQSVSTASDVLFGKIFERNNPGVANPFAGPG